MTMIVGVPGLFGIMTATPMLLILSHGVFDFPNSTGYYEFYSIGAIDDCYETKNNSEALCYYSLTHLDISVYPNSIDFGNVNVGEYARTAEYYFNLSNNGSMCDIAITVNNTQNWTFVNLY
jgi:hypothetical protein